MLNTALETVRALVLPLIILVVAVSRVVTSCTVEAYRFVGIFQLAKLGLALVADFLALKTLGNINMVSYVT